MRDAKRDDPNALSIDRCVEKQASILGKFGRVGKRCGASDQFALRAAHLYEHAVLRVDPKYIQGLVGKIDGDRRFRLAHVCRDRQGGIEQRAVIGVVGCSQGKEIGWGGAGKDQRSQRPYEPTDEKPAQATLRCPTRRFRGNAARPLSDLHRDPRRCSRIPERF